MTKIKVLKIKVGEIFLDNKNIPVFQTAWERTSKKGDTYFEVRYPVFMQEVNKKDNDNGATDPSIPPTEETKM